ncbi:MAG: SDR family oxidoreductase [Saprospiraceae bacterium]
MNFKNKVVIITGSSMGIGKALANDFGQRGAKVVLNGRNPERLEKRHQEMQDSGFESIAISGDVSKVEDCKALINNTIKAFGKIDVLINNAGLSTEGTVEDLSLEVVQKIMEVNYLGAHYLTHLALPYLKKTHGSILFSGSNAGTHGLPKHSVYSASKMALTALTESLRIELQDDEVHVGIAYIGFTENDPNKTIFGIDGKIIAQPSRSNFKTQSPQIVASQMIKMIEKRTYKKVFTPIGKLNTFMARFAPFVIRKVVGNNFRETKKNHKK